MAMYCKEHDGLSRLSKAARARHEPASSTRSLSESIVKIQDLRLIQLKGGNAGVTAREIGRLKQAASNALVKWLSAEFDGETLHLLPDDPIG